MSGEESKQDYWAKAAQAERSAAQTTDIVTRSFLHRMANNYRQLAKFVERNSSKDSSP